MAPIPTSNQTSHHHQLPPSSTTSHFSHQPHTDHDDFFDQMLSSLPSAWSDIGTPKSPWELQTNLPEQKLFGIADKASQDSSEPLDYNQYDDSSMLATRLRQHQISGVEKPMGMQLGHQSQQLFHGNGLIPLPLSLGGDDHEAGAGEGMYNGFGGQMQRSAASQTVNQQHFHNAQVGQSYGGAAPPPPAAAGAAAAPRQRVRARRGQATDPHSIAERLRRERIAERMKALQELVPNANKTDKASMLDEIIDYVKFLQLQVKVLSMSRLGGAGAVAPLVADISSEAGRGGNAAAGSDSLAVTEHQVAKLMEEDMGTAMQYLQGKGLCLMPISLASAISSAGCTPRNSGSAAAALSGLLGAANPGLMLAPPAGNNNGVEMPASPSMSVLTVQSAMANGGEGNSAGKEVGSVSKP